MPTFTYATQKDLAYLKKNDTHVDAKMMKKKITDKQVIIAKEGTTPIGWLRFGLFWDIMPFMNLLTIEEEYRGKGIGKKLVQFWEKEMKKNGHKFVLTSTQSDEDAQHFYRKIGYTEIGGFTLPKEPLEIIFIKKLQK